MIKREYELTGAVSEWLTAQGHDVYTEVPVFHQCVDIIGRRDQHIILVELKIGFCRGAIRQLNAMDLVADEKYLAVARKPTQLSIDLLGRIGAGALLVRDNVVTKLSESCCHKFWDPEKQIILKRLNQMEPGGVAGMPNMLGEGPAIECAKAVDEYRKSHPQASWAELFENVPNHYCSARSMQGSLREHLKLIKWAKANE